MPTPDAPLIADRRLYLTTKGEVVEARDPRRAELLAAAGMPIPAETAARLGLRMEDGRVVWGAAKPESVRAKPPRGK